MKNLSSAVNPELEGDSIKGKKVALAVCVTEIVGEILMILNFLLFTRGLSYHRHINFTVELVLLVLLAILVSICNLVTIKGNAVARVLGGALITATFFYNVMEFFLGLAMMGAENWYENIPTFLSCTAVMLVKFFCVKNIFRNKHVRAYFYVVNKARYGL